ncbi:MAG: MATE family efflux transporter [Dehalococcoidales bacterium]|nr:MATE family efflux transporter [Dehalococcoidales bacterium]
MQDKHQSSSSQPSSSATRFTRDWTQGSLIKNLLSISWPVIINNTLNVIGPTIDLIWVGRLGSDALAAIGVAGIIVMLVHSLMMGVFTGLRSLLSRAIGSRDRELAIHIARQAFVVSLLLGIILAIIGVYLDEWMLSLLGVSPEVVALGSGYMRIQFMGMVVMSLRFLCDGIMQASGDTITPMKLSVVFRIVHVILSPMFIFGLWVFPNLGVNGAAVANIMSQSLGMGLALWILMSGRSRLKFTFSGFRFDPGIIWRLIKIGIPSSIMGMQMQMGQLVLTRTVVPFGTIAVATHSLCQRIDMFLSLPLLGLGIGAGVLVGQNLGAKQPQRAEKSAWMATAISEAILVFLAVIILINPEMVIRIFSSDAGMISVGSSYIRIAAAGYAIISFVLVLQSCISSAGDTLPPMLISLISVWVIQVPLAIFLSHTSLGVFGVRWAIVGGTFLGAIAFVVYFKIGRWKNKRV